MPLVILFLSLSPLFPWFPHLLQDLKGLWPNFFLWLEKKGKLELLTPPISFFLYVFEYGQFHRRRIYDFWLTLSLASMAILALGRMTFLCHFTGVANFHWIYLSGLALAMFLSSSLRVWLALSITLYSRLWAFSPQRVRFLVEESLVLHGRYSPLRDGALFAWRRSLEGGNPRIGPWNKTNIVGGLFLGGVTVSLGGYVAYENYLTRVAAERAASATERAASAAEVQAGIKSVEEHRQKFPPF